MANSKNKLRLSIIILILLLVIAVVYTFYGNYLDTKDKSTAIIEVLENNCECKEIKQSIYVTGIQFEKGGITKEKGEFQMIDCNFKSLEGEANRINEILKNEIKKFAEVDQLKLEFINSDISKSVVINNGIVQTIK